MQRLTRAQMIQFYEFGTVAEVEQLVTDAKSAAQIVLAQQGIEHPELNPAVIEEEPAPAQELEAAATDGEADDVPAEEPVNALSEQKMVGGFQADFPFAAKLVEGGITDMDALLRATDNELLFITGIGPAAVAKIRAAQG